MAWVVLIIYFSFIAAFLYDLVFFDQLTHTGKSIVTIVLYFMTFKPQSLTFAFSPYHRSVSSGWGVRLILCDMMRSNKQH